MKLRDGIAPVLVALLATAGASACASSHGAAAPERAEQAEQDRIRADNDARKAEVNAAQARQDARDADRAQWEAEQRAQFAAAEASQAERDAAQIQATAPAPAPAPQPAGVTAAQPPPPQAAPPPPAPAAAPYPRIAFDETSADLSNTERARLDDMAASLVAHPGRHAVIRAYVVDAGDEDRDVRLAQRRADMVARYLEDHGVTSDRIVTRVFSRDVAYVAGDRRGPYRSVEVVIH